MKKSFPSIVGFLAVICITIVCLFGSKNASDNNNKDIRYYNYEGSINIDGSVYELEASFMPDGDNDILFVMQLGEELDNCAAALKVIVDGNNVSLCHNADEIEPEIRIFNKRDRSDYSHKISYITIDEYGSLVIGDDSKVNEQFSICFSRGAESAYSSSMSIDLSLVSPIKW